MGNQELSTSCICLGIKLSIKDMEKRLHDIQMLRQNAEEHSLELEKNQER